MLTDPDPQVRSLFAIDPHFAWAGTPATIGKTEAISSLQQQLARRPRPSSPRSSALKKCDMEMAKATFRTWRRSMECWLDQDQIEGSAGVHIGRSIATSSVPDLGQTRWTQDLITDPAAHE